MHNLNQDKMFYYGETPWHGLGTRLDRPATAKEAIELSGLDYLVEKHPLYLADGSKLSDHKATVRTDTNQVLGVVGNRYQVVQNVECFDFFDTVVGTGEAKYHTAGALGHGERIWILAKLPSDIIVFNDDIVEKYILLTTTHDGTSSVWMYLTPTRVVCNNTLSQSMRNMSHKIAIRHTGDIQGKVQTARETLGLALKFYDGFEVQAKALVAKQVNAEQVKVYLDTLVFGTGKNAEKNSKSTRLNTVRDTIEHLFRNGKGNTRTGVSGSAWALYNGVTEYVSHMRTVRGVKTDPSKRLEAVVLGSGAQFSAQAFDLALKL